MFRNRGAWQKLLAAVLTSCFAVCLVACAPQSNNGGANEPSGTDTAGTSAVAPAGSEADDATEATDEQTDVADTADEQTDIATEATEEQTGNATEAADEQTGAATEPVSSETDVAAETATEPIGDEAAVVEFVWSAETDCTMCHATQVASLANEECAASLHSALACTVCHTDIEGMEKGHKRVELTDTDGATKLRRSDLDSTVCLACHDLTALADATASSTALTDNNGTVVNPHALSESDSHSRVTCASCHQLHASEPVATVAYEQCTNCHHHGVFECGTCHQ